MPDATDLSVQFNDNDNAFVLLSCSSAAASTGVVSPRIENPTRTTTRRQRRSQDTSTCNYSDFCENDVSRQIEAIALEVETAYKNRRMKKVQSKTVTQSSFSKYPIVKEVDKASSIEMTPEVVKVVPISRVKNTYVKNTHIAPNKKSMHLLHRMFNTKPEDDVPSMRACDSSMSLSSDYSVSSRLNSDFFSMSPMKKTRNFSPQSNAEWAIIE